MLSKLQTRITIFQHFIKYLLGAKYYSLQFLVIMICAILKI